MDFLIGIDTDIFLWLNSHHSPFWDVFMYISSGRAVWIPFYASILIAIYLRFGWRTMLIMGLICGAAVGLADYVTAGLLRPAIGRLRPAHLENPLSEFAHIVFDYRGGRYGFPSSHAANTFALAAFISLLFRSWRCTAFMYFWAIIICYSRIYLGVHYPGDILAGLVIGSILGVAGVLLAKSIAIGYGFWHVRLMRRWCQSDLFIVTGAATFIGILIYTSFVF